MRIQNMVSTAIAVSFALVALSHAADLAPSKSSYDVLRTENAPIDDALERIVPAPYRVMLDDSVPSTMQIVWSNGDNWMDVLRRALAPVGLVAKPCWSSNVIKVYWEKSPMPNAAACAKHEEGAFIVSMQPDEQQSDNFYVTNETTQPESAHVAASDAQEDAPREISTELVSKVSCALPSAKVMWRLMNAAVNGNKIVLVDSSAPKDKKSRHRHAAMCANKLRARLLGIGFPSDSVLLDERQSVRDPSPNNVLIEIRKEGT